MSRRIAISVTSTGGLDVAMDPHFGRAPAFLYVDADSGEEVESVSNEAVSAAHGAGTSAAATVAQAKITAVISGHFGPKALEALRALGIQMYLAPEGLSAREALERFGRGELPQQTIQEFR